MFQIAAVIFRESLEIFLILGVVLAATKNVANRYWPIGIGIFLGTSGAALLAYFTSSISESYEGTGQELMNILLLSLSIVMIFITIRFMKDRSAKLKSDLYNLSNIESLKSYISISGTIAALFFREGSEIVLFITSITTVNNISYAGLFFSVISGLVSGICAGILIYIGIFRTAGKYIFTVTSSMLILVAAGFASEIANLLASADILHVGSDTFWDSSWLVEDNSIVGIVLKVLIGYNSRPTALQISFYLVTLFIFIVSDNIKSYKFRL